MIIKIYLKCAEDVASLYRALASSDNSPDEKIDGSTVVLIDSEGKLCELLVNDKKGVERKGEFYLAQLDVAEYYVPKILYPEGDYWNMAKPIPIDPPFGDRIAVFTPMTSPSILNSGPPEFPRLIAASVWI